MNQDFISRRKTQTLYKFNTRMSYRSTLRKGVKSGPAPAVRRPTGCVSILGGEACNLARVGLGVFEYAEFKNGGNQIVALGFPAKNLKFKIALKTGCACNLAINAPILVVLVSVYMFIRSRN